MNALEATAYLGIGGNLGDIHKTFSAALAELDGTEGVTLIATSPLYSTPPLGGPRGQPPYLNAVAQIETRLAAKVLLRRLLDIEAEFARVRTVRWGPRTLDLDLLLYGPGQSIQNPPELLVPHPRLADRAFVLVPLAQVAPSLSVPGTGNTVAELRDALPESDLAGIRLVSTTWA